MGTPDFAIPVLDNLVTEHEVVAVYTRAPKISGRGNRVNKTPVHLWAEAHHIPVYTPKSLKSVEEQNILQQHQAQLAVVAAYGLILPQTVLDMFPRGCINVHASLLPRWRGAAPIQRAIEAGDKQSGVSIMQMALELDAGDVWAQEAVTIPPYMTGGQLHDALSTVGGRLLLKTLRQLDTLSPTKQDETFACYANKIDKAESLLNFIMPAERILDKIRAFNPYPAMYFLYHGERFKVYEAELVDVSGHPGQIIEGEHELIIAAQNNAIRITKIQREGKQVMDVSALLRGFRFEKENI